MFKITSLTNISLGTFDILQRNVLCLPIFIQTLGKTNDCLFVAGDNSFEGTLFGDTNDQVYLEYFDIRKS